MTSDHARALAIWRNGLDDLSRHRGPCGICGGDDARHRHADSVSGMLIAELLDGNPDAVEIAAEEHGTTPETALLATVRHLLVENAALRARLPRARWWVATGLLLVSVLASSCANDPAPVGTVTDRWSWTRQGTAVRVLVVRYDDGNSTWHDTTIRVEQAAYDSCWRGWTWHSDTGTCTPPILRTAVTT